VNPVRHLKADTNWDAMNQSATIKPMDEGFGQLFDTVRSEMEQPKKVQHAERKPEQQDRLERLDRDDPRLDQDFSDKTGQGIEKSAERLPGQSDGIKDSVASEMDQEEQPAAPVEAQNEAPAEETNPDKGVEGAVSDSAAVPAAIVEAEAAPVVNATIADKVVQSAGQINVVNEVPVEVQQAESAPLNNGLNVNVQNSEAGELIGQQNQGKGEGKGQGQANGLPGERVSWVQQLFVEEEGDESVYAAKQGGVVTKEASAASAAESQPNKDIDDQRINHLDILNRSTQDRSVLTGEHELNASTKGEQKKAQAMETQEAVVERFEPVKNDQAFSGQEFGGRSRHEKGSLEQILSHQGQGEAETKVGQVTRGGNISVMNTGEGTNPADMQENVDRVVKAARASINNGSARIQIRLEPPELGYLRVELKQGGGGLHLQIQATNAKAQQLLQQNSGYLQAALESHGIQTRQIDIQLRLDLNNDQAPEQSQEDYQQQTGSQQADTQDQSGGDGFGQGGSEPLSEQDAIDGEAVGSDERADSKAWHELEFSRLDIHA